MAIFSRRTLHRLLTENSGFLSKKQLKKHVEILNRANPESLAIEWEVVLLNVFDKLGTVRHEPDMGRKPDIHFASTVDPAQEFIADIATVSDRGVDDRTPIQELHIRFSDIIYKKKLRNQSFSLFVGSEVDHRTWPRPNPRLKIPHRNQLDAVIFNDAFYEFLDAVSLSPAQAREHVISGSTPPVDIRITYDPSQSRSSAGWPAYNELTSLVRNTVYSRLEEKANQLSTANFRGHRAIFLCDGGCSHLSMTRYFYEDHIDDVFRHFLKEHPQISFILTFVVQQTFGFDAQRNTVATLYEGSSFPDVGREIKKAINEMGPQFPEAEQSALNAGHQLNSLGKHEGLSFKGGWQVKDDEVKISARGLLELLSGKITEERFLMLHSWKPMANPFHAQLSLGRLITSIEVEKGAGEERDDDWLIMRFGEPDPAISPFRMPS